VRKACDGAKSSSLRAWIRASQTSISVVASYPSADATFPESSPNRLKMIGLSIFSPHDIADRTPSGLFEPVLAFASALAAFFLPRLTSFSAPADVR
jgi:hypothetical protein